MARIARAEARSELEDGLTTALIGLLALFGTWNNNVHYLDLGFLGANLRFWEETLANPASRSITVDIFGSSEKSVGYFCGSSGFRWNILPASVEAPAGRIEGALFLLGGSKVD